MAKTCTLALALLPLRSEMREIQWLRVLCRLHTGLENGKGGQSRYKRDLFATARNSVQPASLVEDFQTQHEICSIFARQSAQDLSDSWFQHSCFTHDRLSIGIDRMLEGGWEIDLGLNKAEPECTRMCRSKVCWSVSTIMHGCLTTQRQQWQTSKD